MVLTSEGRKVRCVEGVAAADKDEKGQRSSGEFHRGCFVRRVVARDDCLPFRREVCPSEHPTVFARKHPISPRDSARFISGRRGSRPSDR